MMAGLTLMKLLLLLFRIVSCLVGEDPQGVFKQGDIVIGGLFPIHSSVIDNTTRPLTKMCDPNSLDILSLLCSQAMVYAIEQINNNSLLSEVKIGYEIYDTCSCVSMALRGSLKLMEGQTHNENQCVVITPSDDVNNTIKAVIGERSSEISVAVARLLALPLMTQISYASSSELLSSRTKFPSFFRTVPSDEKQTEAIAQLVQKFNFVPVGIIGSEDEYGKYGAESLSDYFKMYNICLEFKEILPANFSKDHLEFPTLQNNLFSWRAEAIVLFTKPSNAKIIMEEAINVNVKRTWIASDAWSTAQEILDLKNLSNSGRILGVTCKSHKVPGFSEYMDNFLNQQNTNDSFFFNFLSASPFCPTTTDDQDCSTFASNPVNTTDKENCINKKCLMDFINNDKSYEAYCVYMAVNVITHGLKNVLKNYNDTNFPPWMLTEEIKHVNFTMDNKSYITLNDHGEVDIGYDILEWRTDIPRNISTIGVYEKKQICLVPGVFRDDKNVTQFNCFKKCGPGHELVSRPEKPCCKECIPCPHNYFSEDGIKCESCRYFNNIYCPQQYLPWTAGFSITLGVFTSIGLVLTLTVTVLFSLNLHTPIVKAAGGYMCFPALVSLLGCFSSVFLVLGKPKDDTCRAALPLFSLSFTVCVSCILTNLLQIFVGFTFTLKIGYWLKRINKPVALVSACASVQVFICVLWLVLGPHSGISLEEEVSDCEDGSVALYVIMHVYIALLCIVCFIFAYKGRRLPGLYKNARFVTIGMLIYLVVWIIFIPIYTQEHGIYEEAVKASAILLSGYSILGCHFAPKCFILFCRKELNDENVIAEQIRKHYENKEIRVLS